MPDLTAPDEYRAIVTVHFAVDVPIGFAPLTCLVGGTPDWLFAGHGRLSVTIAASAARRTRAHRAARNGRAVRLLLAPVPPWQVVVEERATFAAIPSQEGRRAGVRTRWNNFTLAGDWTATGLAATIEGAICSGQKAADALMNPSMESR